MLRSGRLVSITASGPDGIKFIGSILVLLFLSVELMASRELQLTETPPHDAMAAMSFDAFYMKLVSLVHVCHNKSVKREENAFFFFPDSFYTVL